MYSIVFWFIVVLWTLFDQWKDMAINKALVAKEIPGLIDEIEYLTVTLTLPIDPLRPTVPVTVR